MPVGKADIDETVEQYEADAKEKSGGADFFKFENGENRIRIIPPAPGVKRFFVRRATHWNVVEGGIEKGEGDNFNCPRALDKTAKCFLCDRVAELEASDDADDKKLAKELRARSQWMYAIVDLDDVEAGIQICGFPKTVHEAVGQYVADDDYGDISDLDDGYNLVVTRKQQKKKITYDTRAKKNPSAAPEAIAEFLDSNDPPDLTKYAEASSFKAMKAAWEGEELDDDDDDKPKKKGKSRRASREDGDEDDEPRKKSKKSKSDDDEDEAPKSKSKAKKSADDDDADADAEDVDDANDEPKKSKSKTADDEASDDADEEEEEEKAETKSKSKDVGKRLGARRRSRR